MKVAGKHSEWLDDGVLWVVEELLEVGGKWSVTAGIFSSAGEAQLIADLWQRGAVQAGVHWLYRVQRYVRTPLTMGGVAV